MFVAWILQTLLIPCYTLLSIGLLMPCILGWSHRFVPWDAFEVVTPPGENEFLFWQVS